MRYLVLFTTFWVFTQPLLAKQSSAQWIDQQWNEIPAKYHVAKPSARMPIELVDRQELASSRNAVVRNRYINHTYNLIGKSFNRCMGVSYPFGNWYYFASWASKSAGTIIDGQKFKTLNTWQEFWVEVLQFTKVLLPQAELQKIFGSVNQMIAIEMIPLGKTFLRYFCQGEQHSWQEFEQLMLSRSWEEKLLRQAFFHYYQAIHTDDMNLKKEHLTLASTWQVISEQKRVDPTLKLVFTAHAPNPLRSFIQNSCTKIGDYKMQSDHSITQIALSNDLKQFEIDPALKTIELPPLKQLYQEQHILNSHDKFYLEGTACRNWGDFNQRRKFLTAMFWIYINKQDLLATPEKQFQQLTDLAEWTNFLLKNR